VPYTFFTTVNAPGGNSVKGLEVTLNVPFTFLKGFWSNFGFASNYTYVSARDSTGLSPNSYNFTGYYDTGKLGVRVSINKRDDYLLSQPGGNGHVQERKYGPTQVDFSAYYNLTKRLSLNIQGINITNEKERIYGTGDGTQYLTRNLQRRAHNGSWARVISSKVWSGCDSLILPYPGRKGPPARSSRRSRCIRRSLCAFPSPA
jgi:outer membrane receptor protein involved in Fe transport